MRALWLVVGLTGCASVVPPPSAEHPRAMCALSCSDGRPLRSVIQKECTAGGRLRGKDISVNGEVVDEQNPHHSAWLAGKDEERGLYPKDYVVPGTCSMYFAFVRHGNDEHMMGPLNTPASERQK